MYQTLGTETIIRTADGASFLRDPSNIAYRQFLAWEALGNLPEADDPPMPSVIRVTPWQIREALNQSQSGLRSAVESAVAASGQEVKDGWEFAQEFRSDNVLIAAVAQGMGKTDADVLALFALAKSLTL